MTRVVVGALPLPVQIDLPPGWTTTDREDDLPDGVALAATHPFPDRGVTATVTVDGDAWPQHQALTDIAASSVERIGRSIHDDVVVTARAAIGSERSPGLTQSLAFHASPAGERREMIQDQVYIGLVDEREPTRRAVIRLVLTVSADQHDEILEAYRSVVASVLPVSAPVDERHEET